MKPALFIDNGGTIVYDYGYTYKVSDLKIYEDAVEIIKKYEKMGYLIVIVTNQSGIGRGYYTVADYEKFMDEEKKELLKRGVKIDATYFCPHKPEDNCSCRKPKTELIARAVKELEIDLKNSIIVGDRQDWEGKMAQELGIKSIILPR